MRITQLQVAPWVLSNVTSTGLISPVHKIARLLHSHDALDDSLQETPFIPDHMRYQIYQNQLEEARALADSLPVVVHDEQGKLMKSWNNCVSSDCRKKV